MTRLKNKGLLIGTAFCCMTMLTGCSIKDTLGILWSSEKEQESTVTNVNLEASNIDESVEKPEITNEMGEPVTYGLNGTAEPLYVESSVSEGTLSYQWYRNNVDSNGGGTAVEGATDSEFVPPTTEAGTTYYYVVVTNTVGDGIQLTTSGTKCVTVTEEPAEETVSGTWQETGKGWWYQYEDGSFPSDEWVEIEGEWYAFDSKGYVRTGWFQDGDNWYYLNEDGTMATDTEVDGYYLGSDGVMQ